MRSKGCLRFPSTRGGFLPATLCTETWQGATLATAWDHTSTASGRAAVRTGPPPNCCAPIPSSPIVSYITGEGSEGVGGRQRSRSPVFPFRGEEEER